MGTDRVDRRSFLGRLTGLFAAFLIPPGRARAKPAPLIRYEASFMLAPPFPVVTTMAWDAPGVIYRRFDFDAAGGT